VNKRRDRECSIQRDAMQTHEPKALRAHDVRVRILHTRVARRTRCRGARRMTLSPPAGTVNVTPMSLMSARGVTEAKTATAAAGDDHGDGVEPCSNEEVPPKDSVAESSGLQHEVAQRPHDRASGARARDGQPQRQGAVVGSPCCSLRRRCATEPPQVLVLPSSQRSWARLCKEERRKKCDIR
jgi:hypothetical protein